MRVRTVVAVGVCAVLGGCGGSGSPGAVAGVRHTLHEFASDLLSSNYPAACALMTPSARERLAAATTALGRKLDCPQLLAFALSQPGARQKIEREAAKLNTLHVSVSGNTARANAGGTVPTVFIMQGGRWLINGNGQ